jgi:hypothetical protein
MKRYKYLTGILTNEVVAVFSKDGCKCSLQFRFQTNKATNVGEMGVDDG